MANRYLKIDVNYITTAEIYLVVNDKSKRWKEGFSKNGGYTGYVNSKDLQKAFKEMIEFIDVHRIDLPNVCNSVEIDYEDAIAQPCFSIPEGRPWGEW